MAKQTVKSSVGVPTDNNQEAMNNQLMQQVQQMMQQGAKPEEVMQQLMQGVQQGQLDPNEVGQILVQLGIPEEQVGPMLQQAMGQAQQSSQEEAMEGAASNPQEEAAENANPQQQADPAVAQQVMAAFGGSMRLLKKALGGDVPTLDNASPDYQTDLNKAFLSDVKNSFLQANVDAEFPSLQQQPMMSRGGTLNKFDDVGPVTTNTIKPEETVEYWKAKNDAQSEYMKQMMMQQYMMQNQNRNPLNYNQPPTNSMDPFTAQHPLLGLFGSVGFSGKGKVTGASAGVPDEISQAIAQGKLMGKTSTGQDWKVNAGERHGFMGRKGKFDIQWGDKPTPKEPYIPAVPNSPLASNALPPVNNTPVDTNPLSGLLSTQALSAQTAQQNTVPNAPGPWKTGYTPQPAFNLPPPEDLGEEFDNQYLTTEEREKKFADERLAEFNRQRYADEYSPINNPLNKSFDVQPGDILYPMFKDIRNQKDIINKSNLNIADKWTKFHDDNPLAEDYDSDGNKKFDTSSTVNTNLLNSHKQNTDPAVFNYSMLNNTDGPRQFDDGGMTGKVDISNRFKIEDWNKFGDSLVAGADKMSAWANRLNDLDPVADRGKFSTENLYQPLENNKVDRGQYDQFGRFLPSKIGANVQHSTNTGYTMNNPIFAMGGNMMMDHDLNMGSEVELTDREKAMLESMGYQLKAQ